MRFGGGSWTAERGSCVDRKWPVHSPAYTNQHRHPCVEYAPIKIGDITIFYKSLQKVDLLRPSSTGVCTPISRTRLNSTRLDHHQDHSRNIMNRRI
jgi:hypothetical protein